MSYQETRPRRDFRRYRKVINTEFVGSQLLGGLEDGWAANPNMYFWITTMHLSLGLGLWLAGPSLTLGAGASDTNLIGTAQGLGINTLRHLVRTPFGPLGMPADLISVGTALRCNVTVPGVVSGPGESPLISVDYLGYWESVINTVT